MVGNPDRRWLPHPPMAHLPRGHVHPPGVAAYLVGARCRLAFRPKRVWLGYGGVQVLRLADGIGCPLADAVGEAASQAGPAGDEVIIPAGGYTIQKGALQRPDALANSGDLTSALPSSTPP